MNTKECNNVGPSRLYGTGQLNPRHKKIKAFFAAKQDYYLHKINITVQLNPLQTTPRVGKYPKFLYYVSLCCVSIKVGMELDEEAKFWKF